MDTWLIILLVVVALLVVFLIATYNGLVKLKNRVEEAWSDITVQLKRRTDLIPNLVNSVKGYATHEKETFEKISALRAKSYDSMSTNEKVDANKSMGGFLGTIMATAEAYPELKANENFLDLQNQLKQIEDDIANSRKYYNGCVRVMNTAVESFPSNIIAGMFHFERYSMYEVEDASERQNVKVEF